MVVTVLMSQLMPDTKGKRVAFDIETWQALDQLARSRMMTFQELADEAFRDLMKKHGLPYDTRDAFRRSAAVARKAKPATPTAKKKPAKRRVR